MAFIVCHACAEPIKRDIRKLQGPDLVASFHRDCYEKALDRSETQHKRDRRDFFRNWNRYGQAIKRQQVIERSTLTHTTLSYPVLGKTKSSTKPRSHQVKE